MFVYGITTLLSAFLLFQVEMILAKFLLPWFGGGASVWTACVLFFQLLLTLGYAYSHLLAARFSPRAQTRIHLALLAIALAVLGVHVGTWSSPILPGPEWKPSGNDLPAARILLLLAVAIGFPFFVLSATTSLLQVWLARRSFAPSPYRLYGISNAGSMLGLLSYPFVVEPALRLRTQGWLWTGLFALFAIACAWCARTAGRSRTPDPSRAAADLDPPPADAHPPRLGRCVLWTFLAFCPSVLFLATTNVISEEITVVPFLWTIPLAVYLLSFVLCFQEKRRYFRRLFVPGGLAAAVMVFCVRFNRSGFDSFPVLGAVYCFTLFVCCMICHGELAGIKPHPRHLTLYYLMLSIGGALGGVFVAVVAPAVFDRFWELDIGYLGTVFALVIVMGLDRTSAFHGRWKIAVRWAAWAVVCAMVLSACLLQAYDFRGNFDPLRRIMAAAMQVQKHPPNPPAPVKILALRRNFYGRIRITDRFFNDPERHERTLFLGGTTHGSQLMHPSKRRTLTTYYADTSGLHMAVDYRRRRAAAHGDGRLRIGGLGLGVGTIAGYGRAGDYLRFYEINPMVIGLSVGPEPLFSFVSDCPGKVDIIPGDGRLSLENEPPQQFDVLVLDVFDGSAIPLHLMTREAIGCYLRHLAPDGILALHITNRYLDFEPVVRKLADACGLTCVLVRDASRQAPPAYPTVWMLLSRRSDFARDETISRAASPGRDDPRRRAVGIWTDDHSNLFQILRR